MNELVNLLQRAAKIVEVLGFVIAAVLGVVSNGQLGTTAGHGAVIAGALGAAAHGITHTTGEPT